MKRAHKIAPHHVFVLFFFNRRVHRTTIFSRSSVCIVFSFHLELGGTRGLHLIISCKFDNLIHLITLCGQLSYVAFAVAKMCLTGTFSFQIIYVN